MRAVPSYGGKYLVTDDGRVYSAWNTRNNPLPEPKLLTSRIRADGYSDVQIRFNGKNMHPLVHVLVCEAFLGPKNGMDCNHKDGNKGNNHISNLEYLTRSGNVLHALLLGLKVPARGRQISRTRLHESDVPKIRSEVRSIKRVNGRAPTGSIKAIAEKYGVTAGAIDGIARGITWKHVP